jgi:predicted O-methyltransferase YrrM
MEWEECRLNIIKMARDCGYKDQSPKVYRKRKNKRHNFLFWTCLHGDLRPLEEQEFLPYKFLFEQVRAKEKAEIIIEIGTNFGLSMYVMHCAKPDAKLYTIAYDSPLKDVRFRYITEKMLINKDNVIYKKGLSQRQLYKLETELGKESCDVIFVDGEHTDYGVLTDTFNSQRLIKDDGLLIYHDYDRPDIRKACDYYYQAPLKEFSLKHDSTFAIAPVKRPY